MGGLNSSTPRHTFIYVFWCGSAIIFFVLLLCLNSYSLVLFSCAVSCLTYSWSTAYFVPGMLCFFLESATVSVPLSECEICLQE